MARPPTFILATLVSLGVAGPVACSGGSSNPGPSYVGREPAGGGQEPGTSGSEPGSSGAEPGTGGSEPSGSGGREPPGAPGSGTLPPSGGSGQGSGSGSSSGGPPIGSSSGGQGPNCLECAGPYDCSVSTGGNITISPLQESDGSCVFPLSSGSLILDCNNLVYGPNGNKVGVWAGPPGGTFTATGGGGVVVTCSPQ